MEKKKLYFYLDVGFCAYMQSMMQKSLVIHAYVMFVFKRMLCHSSIICVRHHFMLDGIESLFYSCIQQVASRIKLKSAPLENRLSKLRESTTQCLKDNKTCYLKQ
ncbi:hypothetical protein HanOQP8_Chr04g0142321 [Helianthus annuus]|nr:hypothetical protein HanOQP8_Chr04g0142321 [Helianthus annuus]